MFMNANHGISSTTTAKISVRRLGRASRLPKTHSPLDEYACPCGGKRGHEYNFATRRDKESPHTVYRHALGYFCLCFASVCVGDDRSWVVAGSWRHPRRNAFSFHSYLTYLFRLPPPPSLLARYASLLLPLSRHPLTTPSCKSSLPLFSAACAIAAQRRVHGRISRFLCRSDLSGATSASTATFVTALVFNAAVFGIELGIFTLVRPFFPAIYQPRTYIPPKR